MKIGRWIVKSRTVKGRTVKGRMGRIVKVGFS